MWELLKDLYYRLKVLMIKMTWILIDQFVLYELLKRLILWTEGTEGKNDLVNI